MNYHFSSTAIIVCCCFLYMPHFFKGLIFLLPFCVPSRPDSSHVLAKNTSTVLVTYAHKHIFYFLCPETHSEVITLPSIMKAKLSQQRFRPCHEHINTMKNIPIPHNVCGSFKSGSEDKDKQNRSNPWKGVVID